jgi:Arc/MetJ family transcription regulator
MTFSGTAAVLVAEGVVAAWVPARHVLPYIYGIIVCMKKTLHIDERLLSDAKSASGSKTDTETVRLGLEALVRRGAYERLRALRGSEPNTREIPRRRERSSSTRHSGA